MFTNILIVEDQTDLAENLFEFLGEDRYRLDFAADGLTALHLLATRNYDVIVLDVMLPGLSGFEICAHVRNILHCSTPIIFMTARGTLGDKEQGFTSGGDDYLVKPFALRELQLRIDALARRDQFDNGVLQVGPISFDPGTLCASMQGVGSVELTGLSSRIFELLLRTYPRFVSYEDLSNALWGTDEGDHHALRNHVYGLRKTLDMTFGKALIKTVHGRGYRLELQGEFR